MILSPVWNFKLWSELRILAGNLVFFLPNVLRQFDVLPHYEQKLRYDSITGACIDFVYDLLLIGKSVSYKYICTIISSMIGELSCMTIHLLFQ